jgi:hypothetical protein
MVEGQPGLQREILYQKKKKSSKSQHFKIEFKRKTELRKAFTLSS